jgi:glycosyltransferase involved in cell wall biosynthesis
MSSHPHITIAIKQIRGNSGIDVWAENLCRGINAQGHRCTLGLFPGYLQFMPGLLTLKGSLVDSDIIHGSTWNGYTFRNERPLVITEHHVINDPAFNPYRTLPQKMYHRWIYRCEQKTLNVADFVTCVSQFTQKKLEEVFGYTGSRVIYNGVDTTVFRPMKYPTEIWNIPRNKTVLFFAGNLSRRKGADLLPAIMKNLGEDYVLLLATGQTEISLGSLNNINNIGHLDLAHLVMAYNRCDIFLSASRLEGFGLSVAEAMACGKPVVATNGSSIPELVINEKGGLLCEMDNVKDFSEKIRYLSENENEQKTMGMFNRQRVIDNFESGAMTKAYIALYNKLLASQ